MNFARRPWRAWFTAVSLLATCACCWGCGKPLATEPNAAATVEVAATTDTPANEAVDQANMPAESAAAETSSSADAAATEAAADPVEPQDWQPSDELAKKLTAEPADLGGYSMRLPEGFVEAGRAADNPDSKQPYLFAFQSPVVEGATPAIISVTIHPPGEEFPERDVMLAAYFANVATQWPDSQRHETEQGSVSGFPTARAFYEAELPADLTIKGVVYLIDHGTQRVVLQGVASSSTPDFPIELIDAAIQSFGRKKP